MKTISKNKKYVYHSTTTKHIDDILEKGITSKDTNIDSQLILDVLNEFDYNDYFPFCRENVNYFHIDEEIIEYDLNLKSFNKNSAFIVVDITKINSPIYIADMSIITNLIDYACGGEWLLRDADSVEEAIKLYKQSIYEINSVEDMYKYDRKINGNTELIIDGDIPPSKIINIIYK